MIHWPAIIQYAGQAELAYVSDQAQWATDKHLHAFNYLPADRLMDSNGKVWSLTNKVHQAVVPELNGKIVSLDELIILIRAHASQIGNCCVAKFSASSIEEAIRMLDMLDE